MEITAQLPHITDKGLGDDLSTHSSFVLVWVPSNADSKWFIVFTIYDSVYDIYDCSSYSGK